MTAQLHPLSLTTLAQKVRRRVRYWLRGERPGSYFDLHDRDLINRTFAKAGIPPLDVAIHEAVLAGDSARAESIYELREDVRRAIPLALTPAQRGAYLTWFLDHGRQDAEVEPLDLLRLMVEQDAEPDRGLVATYLVQPEWQSQFPDALTPAGWGPFKDWLAREYRITGRWLRRARLPAKFTAPRDDRSGVNAIGFFRYTSGLQQAAAAMVHALGTANVPVELRDVPMAHHRDSRRRAGFDGLERGPITILNTGLDLPVPEVYRLAGLHPRDGVYRIAMWWWELEQLPIEWLDRGEPVQEIWAPTTFIANALRVLAKPVVPMLPSVRLPAFAARPKSHFGLDPHKFTFLFVFDMYSRMPRKNPLALIRAFRRAFRPEEPVELAIKVSQQDSSFGEWWADLRGAARDNGVTLIDRSLSRDELLGLMNAADAYVSLHRSEGFGLTMAEAMLLGKPTIATAYSGNLDFMTVENSYLVRYENATIAEDIPPYPKGAVWAEPSVEHAAELMRRVVDQPTESRAIAARGRAEAEALLCPAAAGRRLVSRLAEIRRG